MRMRIYAALSTLLLGGACTNPPTSDTPPGVPPGSVAEFRQVAGDRVFFDLDSAQLRADGRDTLDKQADWLKRYGTYAITIEGHADERGTREYNLALGARRAQSVTSYLAAQGVPATRLKTTSYGKERPEVIGADEGAWSRNRRGVTTLQ